MQIHPLSIVVPTPVCVNNCPFCVSKMSCSPYINQIEKNKRFIDLYEKDFKDRLAFARDSGYNTVVLTGDGEPLQNWNFLRNFSHWNEAMGDKRFYIVELQTTGVLLDDEKLRFLRNAVRVSAISLSVCDIFDSKNNAKIIGMPKALQIDLDELCAEIKKYDFTLRLSINLINMYDNISEEQIFARLKELQVDQVMFKILYESGNGLPQDEWVKNNAASTPTINRITDYVESQGKALEVLPFGATRYSVDGISTAVNGHCMPKEVTNSFRYMILRQNSKIYSRWDDPGSLIF